MKDYRGTFVLGRFEDQHSGADSDQEKINQAGKTTPDVTGNAVEGPAKKSSLPYGEKPKGWAEEEKHQYVAESESKNNKTGEDSTNPQPAHQGAPNQSTAAGRTGK